MSKLTESAIKDFVIKLFERLGCDCIRAPDSENMLPKLMSGKMRVELELDTQGRKYNHADVAG